MSRNEVTTLGIRCLRILSLALMSSAIGAFAQSLNISERYLFAAANRDRIERGLPALSFEPALAKAAETHAQVMALHGTISHQFSGEADLASRAGYAGARFSLVTENVAEAGNAALIHDLWMQSEGHRANLLDPKVDSVGIAVVVRGGQLYAVEDFSRTVERLSLAEQEIRVSKLLEETGIRLIPDARDAELTCSKSSGYVGQRRPWYVMRFTTPALTRLPEELSQRLAGGRYHEAAVGACDTAVGVPFTSYSIAILLYP